MSTPNQQTPMMAQWQRVRETLTPETILLFRFGDFYEMFYGDAKDASGILTVALTKRNGVPMCGIPVHSRDRYIRTLIDAGKKVAICEEIKTGAIIFAERP